MADTSSTPEVGEGSVPPPRLMKAEVSWMSTVRGDLSYKERILRRVRGILNKLTVEKYTLLRNQFIDSGITTLSILDGVASLIFNKAVKEPMFCPLYAFLCYELSLPPHGLPSVLYECVQQEITFKRLLVSKCQEAFENENRKVAETRQQIVTGVSSDVRYKERRRNLGDMQFICELMKQRHPILRISLAHHILYQLLDPNDVEVNVEAICLFLNTVGKEVDELSSKARTNNDVYLSRLEDVLTTHPQLETRLKLMIRNLLDLRANNWVDPRHNKVKEKTIPELISAAEAEALSRLHPGASTSTNTRNHRAVQFRPVNRLDAHRW
ncbi:hypothetical protein MKW98_001723 [Papaver atlanticum]|uniref:MIF4G domain-containing protein n=1 Tax=Papaver atlanticum TaxID=357466 RepID=A0AAD4S6G8_9MAGN|nr:hypothetical protein MKW98_001723 [Papaver atlanticum]